MRVKAEDSGVRYRKPHLRTPGDLRFVLLFLSMTSLRRPTNAMQQPHASACAYSSRFNASWHSYAIAESLKKAHSAPGRVYLWCHRPDRGPGTGLHRGCRLELAANRAGGPKGAHLQGGSRRKESMYAGDTRCQPRTCCSAEFLLWNGPLGQRMVSSLSLAGDVPPERPLGRLPWGRQGHAATGGAAVVDARRAFPATNIKLFHHAHKLVRNGFQKGVAVK